MEKKKTGENLNAIRQERKITVKKLARKLDVSNATVFNHIKNGITTIDFLLMYCEALGCEPTDILDGCTDLSRYTVREDVASLYPYNIAIQLFINTPYPTDEKISEALEQMYKVYIPSFLEAISNLTEREQEVLWCRYKHDMTLEQTGKKFNVTKERIRQIERKAIRKLRNPRYSKHYIFDTLDKYFEAVSEKTRLENENERLREKLKSVGEMMVNDAVDPVAHQPISIDRLDLSVRAYNCLKRAGVKTLDDLKNMSYLQLTRLRNMGEKSATEIVESARKFGIDIT